MKALQTILDEERYRMVARQRSLEQAKDWLRRYEKEDRHDLLYQALVDLTRVIDMLSASEDRSVRLYAECVAMLEHGRKILELESAGPSGGASDG